MNTTTNTNQIQIVAQSIASLIKAKGTCFAGFDYDGKRRNLTLGADLTKKVTGVGNWGESEARGSIVKYKNNYYLQGIPNNESNPHIKRFKMDKIENLVIG
jgi:hypothetical protein